MRTGALIAAAAIAAAVPSDATANAANGRRVDPAEARAPRVELTPRVPATLLRGDAVTLVLQVTEAGRPIDDAVACVRPSPVFLSIEDALDSTPAGGADLGAGSGGGAGCAMAIAGVPAGPGTYEFAWEPDTSGRVNLAFSAGGAAVVVPVDVGSRPPDAAALLFFSFAVAASLTAAALVRRYRGVRAP